MADPVNHPAHYTSHPSGVECIDVVEHMGFNLGNAIKYIWRADEKGNALEDLRKAAWYVQREIERREKDRGTGPHSLACIQLPHLHGNTCHGACPTCAGFEEWSPR